MKNLRQTHTFVELPVSKTVFMEIYKKLRAADYDHCFIMDDSDVKKIDMNGIALVIEKE